VNTDGGTVVFSHRPYEVDLQTATPASGFGVEIDDAGPEKLRVEFKNDSIEYRVEAEWIDGSLVVEVTEH
jgi:hypothetical protein